MYKANSYIIIILFFLNCCKAPNKTNKLLIHASANSAHPLKIGVGNFFPFGVTINLIDTINATIKYDFVPGEIVSINNDTSLQLIYPDSLHIDYTTNPVKVYNSNYGNKSYNLFFNDLAKVLAPINQINEKYFSDKKDSILDNEDFILNYLSKTDDLISKEMKSLFVKYRFSPAIQSEILSSILETKKISLSYYYFSNYIEKFDSIGVLPSRMRYYIEKINQQKITPFSQKEISILIESIFYQKTQRSIRSIQGKDELEDLYISIKNLSPRGSIFFDYIVSSLFVQAKRKKIKLRGATLVRLKKDALKSQFKIYTTSNSLNSNPNFTGLNNDDNYYDINLNSTNLLKIVSQFHNKPLLIDFWASWCLPCYKKFPEIFSYKAQYKNLNIVFISLDMYHDIWKLSLYKYDLLKYLHYRRNYNNQDKLFSQIPLIPKYGLLQKNGQIVLIDDVTDSVLKAYYESF